MDALTASLPGPNEAGISRKNLPFVGLLFEMRKDPLKFFAEVSREGDEVIPLKLGFETIHLINHPEHLQRIFRDNKHNYIRSKYYGQLSPIIGNGLFTLEGEAWRHQRSNSQPAVSGPNLMQMTNQMVAATKERLEMFQKYSRNGQTFDITTEAFHLKLDIVMRALFSTQLHSEDFVNVLTSLTVILKEIETRIWELFPTPLWLKTRRNLKLQTAIKDLNNVIGNIIEERLAHPSNTQDLLDTLIASEKSKGWDNASLKSIQDQVISIAIAGHETGAISLCWLTYTLSKYPEICKKVRDEANRVFGNRDPDFKAFQELKFTQKVVKEILRLYPPLWTVSREAIHQDYLGKHSIPKGAIVMISPYVMHRNPRFWSNPEGFDPERFSPEQETRRHKFAYFPFGGGPHLCLGNRFGMLEGVISLAMICQNYDLELCTAQKFSPVPMTTLRPSGPMFVKVKQPHLKLQLKAA